MNDHEKLEENRKIVKEVYIFVTFSHEETNQYNLRSG